MGIETQTDLARERSDSIAIDDMCITDADYPVGDPMVAMLAFTPVHLTGIPTALMYACRATQRIA